MTPTPANAFRLAGLLLVSAGSMGCDPPLGPKVHHTSCDDAPGIVHTHAAGRWKAADGPHRLEQPLVSGSELTIEAGALICAGPGATLEVGELSAVGTAEAPITFTALDPQDPWHGLAFNHDCCRTGNWTLHHVIIRNGAGGVRAQSLDLRRARVENMCQGGTCTAVAGTGYGGIELEDVVIDGSGGAGVSSGWRASISLTRVRILNSQDVGLRTGWETNLAVGGLRITGGESYPASVVPEHVLEIAGSREAVDSLLGNAKDTLNVMTHDWGGIDDHVTIFPELPWRVGRATGDGTLWMPGITMQAGASIAFERGVWWGAPRIDAQGTESDPVMITGGDLVWGAWADADTVRFNHVIFRAGQIGSFGHAGIKPALEFEHMSLVRSTVWVPDGSTLRMRSSALDSSQLIIDGGSAALTGVRVTKAAGTLPHAITIEGGTLSLEMCTITDSDGDAIHVTADAPAGTTITGCNLFGNTGFGVNNLSAFTVDAGGNWWGDAAGPSGADGDGVAGDVIVEPVLTSPVQR